jgi:hypothetical protein
VEGPGEDPDATVVPTTVNVPEPTTATPDANGGEQAPTATPTAGPTPAEEQAPTQPVTEPTAETAPLESSNLSSRSVTVESSKNIHSQTSQGDVRASVVVASHKNIPQQRGSQGDVRIIAIKKETLLQVQAQSKPALSIPLILVPAAPQ